MRAGIASTTAAHKMRKAELRDIDFRAMERPRKYPTNPSATVTSPSQFMGLKPRAKSNQMKESWRIRDCSMEEAFQPIYRFSQVATRVPFIFFAEKVCVENVLK